ncbi:MAG: hypothetical protein A2W19_14595 [Spirochaetes bacterium RBG_16_49_21]|nr:MAG: hypothetical protein A2W19_14595 [Spirochaetes bacterium RBG_16_49_21]
MFHKGRGVGEFYARYFIFERALKMNGIVSNMYRIALAVVFFIMPVFISCDDDDFDKYLTYESIPPALLIPPVGYPVPGNNGLITTGAISETSIQLFWVRASDAVTSQADLEYRLFRSDSYNIATVAEAEGNGTAVTGWTRDMTGATATALTPGRSYFFNVLVRDSEGNRAAYLTVSSTTVSNAIYMFSAGTHDGQLTTMYTASARADIDTVCIDAKADSYPALPCLNVRTFISITSSDEIARMPTNFGVPTGKKIIGPAGTQIANDWTDLLDGAIDEELQNAGISSDFWWSGSGADGRYLSTAACITCNTCTGWTDGTNAFQGMTGAHNRTNSDWINYGNTNCNTLRAVLCICW